MNKEQGVRGVTELIIKALKSDIAFHQQQASAALTANRPAICADHLNKQAVAIDSLIKLAETYARIAPSK
jgi:hypothetical protein